MGCRPLPWSCCSTAPMAKPDASVCTTKGRLGSGRVSTGPCAMASLRRSNAYSLRLGPLELHVVLGELGQRRGQLAEVPDELAVVAGGAEEGAHVPHAWWAWATR